MKDFIHQRRWASLLVILLIYVVAAAVGALAFLLTVNMHFVLRMLLADLAATVIVWLFGVLLKNSSVYDPYWSVAPPFLFIGAAVFYGASGVGVILTGAVIMLWAVRLTGNWIYTFSNLNWQDWRYVSYKQRFPRLWHLINLFGINVMPTLFVFAGMLPVFAALENGGGESFGVFLGAAVCVSAVLVELVADTQMHRFRKSGVTGRVNNVGLWAFSRHPNYFGEVSFWFGLYIIMLFCAPQRFYLLVCPLAIALMFIFISIPLMEKRQLERKPAYAEYKRITSMLIPLPRRKPNEAFAAPEEVK